MFKFLRTGLQSERGKCTWQMGKWKKSEAPLTMCSVGFHASPTPLDALRYVKGEILAEVKVRGESIKGPDKECWEEMCIAKAWRWTTGDSVALAIYAADLALPIFEKTYPKDKRPRKAIAAAARWLKKPADAHAADAAYAAADAAARAADADADAHAADAAYAAADAAYAAARAAGAAARAADAAARAAGAAARAADAAARAAGADAAAADVTRKINAWIVRRVGKKPAITSQDKENR